MQAIDRRQSRSHLLTIDSLNIAQTKPTKDREAGDERWARRAHQAMWSCALVLKAQIHCEHRYRYPAGPTLPQAARCALLFSSPSTGLYMGLAIAHSVVSNSREARASRRTAGFHASDSRSKSPSEKAAGYQEHKHPWYQTGPQNTDFTHRGQTRDRGDDVLATRCVSHRTCMLRSRGCGRRCKPAEAIDKGRVPNTHFFLATRLERDGLEP